MAEAVIPKKTKKDLILDIYKQAPTLSNKKIAEYTGASISYVSRLLGARETKPLNDNDIKKRQIRSHSRRVQKIIWSQFKQSQLDFVRTYLPTVVYKAEIKPNKEGDFVNYILPTDDQFEASGSGADLSGSWSQYQYLAEKRIGIGQKITRFPAEDAVREGFKFLNKKTKEVVERPDIETWMEDTDFLNELAKTIYFERVYGVSFLVAYYSKEDKMKGKLGDPYQKSEGKPIAFEALPPTEVSPVNFWESEKLDHNPQKWTVRGGLFNPQQIHYSRVRVFMSRPVVNRWYGLSVFEPIWDSAIPYYQALIFLLRGFAKWGNLIPIVTVDSEDSVDDVFDENVDVVEDMKMNGTFIFPRGTEVAFANTNLATGLREMMDIWIEDVSSGTGIPVPVLMGRVVASGLGNNGYAIMERYYWNTVKKIQKTFTDDVRAILIQAGFNIKDLIIDWNLTITKTDQQRLMDEGMAIENEILKERLLQEKIMTDRALLEQKMMEEGKIPIQEGSEGETKPKGGNGEAKKTTQNTKDFLIELRKKRLTTDMILTEMNKKRAKLLQERGYT